MKTKPLALGIATYILAHPGETLTTLEGRAKSKDWYTPDTFYSVMTLVNKDPRISATVHGKEVVYKAKQKRAPIVLPALKIEYPIMDETNNAEHEAFEMMCMCFYSCPVGKAEQLYEDKKAGRHQERCYFYAQA